MDTLDTIRGIYHFLGDRAPKNVPVVEPKPHKINPWRRNGQAVVAKVRANGDIRQSIDRAIALLGGLGHVFGLVDKVLVKPNFNSPDPFPASTDIPFLRAVIEMLLEMGAKVIIGESSGGIWRPSRNVFQKKGAYELARDLKVELIAFEDRPDEWVRIKINGDYLKEVMR